MKQFLVSLCLTLMLPAFSMGFDSVKVDGKSFSFFVPRKWKVISKDTGICISNSVNVRLAMPSRVPCSFGEIDISISHITYSEREFRKQSDTLPKEENFEFSWVKKKTFSGYDLTNGHYITDRAIQQSYWDSLRGGKPYSGKEKRHIKRSGGYPIRYISHWNHFLINDSLEIIIEFHGDLPSSYDSGIAYIVDYITDNFFSKNQKAIDALLITADPYRYEPSITAFDSIFFLNTLVRYPLLPEWTFDTTRSSTDIRTKLLHLDHRRNDSCSHASITMHYRVTKLSNQSDKEDFKNLTLAELYKLYRPYKNLSDPDKVKYSDSTFNAAVRHYYFSRNSETTKSENCITKLDYSETIFIIVYTKSKEKIRISIKLNEVTNDFIQERNYRHDLYRFVGLMSEVTDFEQFYLNNK